MYAGCLKAKEGRLEEGLGCTEALVANGNDLSVGQLVGLFESRGLGGGLHLLLKVEGNVAKLLLDVAYDFALCGGGKRVASLHEDLDEMLGEVPSGEVEAENGVGKGVALIDGDGVSDAVARVEDNTRGSARGVEGEDGLDGDVEGWGVEGLEHDLGHLLAVGLWIERGLGEEDGVLFGGDSELVVEGVVPDLLHIVPISHDTVLNRVLESEDTSLRLGLVTDIRVLAKDGSAGVVEECRQGMSVRPATLSQEPASAHLLAHADHHTLVAGSTNNRGEDGSGRVITGETGCTAGGHSVGGGCNAELSMRSLARSYARTHGCGTCKLTLAHSGTIVDDEL